MKSIFSKLEIVISVVVAFISIIAFFVATYTPNIVSSIWFQISAAATAVIVLVFTLARNYVGKRSREQKSTIDQSASAWRPWGDHPLVVAVLVVTALIGTSATIAPFIISARTYSFVGRVLDATTEEPIQAAEVILDIQGLPSEVYTDSNGVFRFSVASESVAGRIRISVNNYESYERIIFLSSVDNQLEDIRLNPHTNSNLLSGIVGRWEHIEDNSVWYEFNRNGTWRGTVNGSDVGEGVYDITNNGTILELSINEAEGVILYRLTIDGDRMVWVASVKYVLTFERVR